MTTRTDRPSPVLLAILAVVLLFAAVHFGRQLLAGESPSVAEPAGAVEATPEETVTEAPPEWTTPDRPRNPFAPTLGATDRLSVDAADLPEMP